MGGKPCPTAIEESVIAALPVPAVITTGRWINRGATILFANREFCALTGYSVDELTGKNTRLLHGPRTDLPLPRQTGSASTQSLDQAEGEGWLYRKDGREFFGHWTFRGLSRRKTGPMMVIYRDDSEHWHQRESLVEAQKLGTIGLLAGGVAHDFNNLLSVINSYAEIMGPKVAGLPAAHKDLQEIHRAGLKASSIARQILEFSRRNETEPKVINFNTLIREIAEIIRRVAGEGIAVELRLASDLGNARISPIYFQQVLLNLCFNAHDAMPQGGRLTLRTFNHQSAAKGRSAALPAGSYAALQVSDTGPGITPKEQAKIFDTFYTTKLHGTGLGLSTSREIIRGARGRLMVDSTPGQGTRFSIYLPENSEAEEVGATELGMLSVVRGTESVLVIEQDEGLRKIIAGILLTDGYTVTAAATIAPDSQPGLDHQLLITDNGTAAGIAFIVKMLEQNAQLRVICTAARSPKIPGLFSRQYAHLPKPFALSSLLIKIRALLDEREK